MKSEHCNRLNLEDNPYHKCNLCKKDVPHSCLQTHFLLCKRMYECKSCGLVLHAKSIKALQVNVDKHKCFSKLCKICFTHIPPKDFKQHACVLKDVKWHSVYNRLAYYDLECVFEEGMSSFEPIMFVCEYENVLFGSYSRFSWADKDIKHPELGKVIDNVGRYNYMGNTLFHTK